jgi:hypothetical protein
VSKVAELNLDSQENRWLIENCRLLVRHRRQLLTPVIARAYDDPVDQLEGRT